MPKVVRGEIARRFDFGLLANRHGVVDAVEVGVDRGQFAWHFLDQWTGYGNLHLIDPWLPYTDVLTGGRGWSQEPNMLQAILRLMPHVDRAKFIRLASPECIASFQANWRFQFVYLDGIHEYGHVRKEVEAWYDRIDRGGIVAGHDYCSPQNGVAKAVNEFADSRTLTVHLVNELIPSFYLIKP